MAKLNQIDVPTAEPQDGVYEPRHIDLQLTVSQRRTLRRIVEGCDREGRRLANGRRIVNASDAIRYLLELVAEVDHRHVGPAESLLID